jgi:outer membrane protein
MMKKKYLSMLLIILLATNMSRAFAVDLLDVYLKSLECDPVFQKAAATRMSQNELLPQQVATLFPTIGVSANTSWNGTNTLMQPIGTTQPPLGLTNYNAEGFSFTFSQPLLNLNNWFLKSRASAIAKQADATFIAAGEDLILRVARAYFTVLNAEDVLLYAKQQKDANAQQLSQARQRYKHGVDTVTTIYNAQASYDAAITQVIAAESDLEVSLEALRQLTGQYYPAIKSFKQEPALVDLSPKNSEWWVDMAAQHNWTFIAARYASIAAKENIKANFSNHAPTVLLTASYGSAYGQSTGTINSRSSAVGLQLNVPLFEGGLVSSQTRQAQDDYVSAIAEREDQYRQATISARQKYIQVNADINKIKADHATIISSQRSIETTEEAFKVGTRTIVDVLLAQQALYNAQRQLSSDRYNYLLDVLSLKQAIGNLTIEDLRTINQWL